MKLHPSITNAPMSRELYGLSMRKMYDSVLAERIPDSWLKLLDKLK